MPRPLALLKHRQDLAPLTAAYGREVQAVPSARATQGSQDLLHRVDRSSVHRDG